MCRASRRTMADSDFVSGRVVFTRTPVFRSVRKIVTGGFGPTSMTRASSHFAVSRAYGGRWYHPLLATVRRKLKFRGVGIFSSIGEGHSSNLLPCMVHVRSS